MGFLIVLLTALMLLDCIFLVLLILMQLPKKEAGAGLAFGGAATDALFGAGSGNFLTKATKYAAVVFFAFAVLLSMLETQHYRETSTQFQRALEQPSHPAPVANPGAAPRAPESSTPVVRSDSNLMLLPPSTAGASNNPAPQP